MVVVGPGQGRAGGLVRRGDWETEPRAEMEGPREGKAASERGARPRGRPPGDTPTFRSRGLEHFATATREAETGRPGVRHRREPHAEPFAL